MLQLNDDTNMTFQFTQQQQVNVPPHNAIAPTQDAYVIGAASEAIQPDAVMPSDVPGNDGRVEPVPERQIDAVAEPPAQPEAAASTLVED